MADLPERAKRAGVKVVLTEAPEAPAPYSTGAGRRACSRIRQLKDDPEGKWKITPETLAGLRGNPVCDLDRAALMLRTGGVLAYATCSLLERENGDQTRAFLARHPGWSLDRELRLTPLAGGDGFYLAILREVADFCRSTPTRCPAPLTCD